jgi:FixJ family two-component response regulator
MIEKTEDEIIFEAKLKTLSPTQRKVADMVVAGMSSKAIGEVLGISHRTVDLHRGAVLKRTDCENIAALAYRMAFHDFRRLLERPANGDGLPAAPE